MISVLSGSSHALTCLHAPVFDIESSYLSEHTTKCVDMTLSLCAHPCNKAFGRASKFGEADLHDDQCSQSLKNENWHTTHPETCVRHGRNQKLTYGFPQERKATRKFGWVEIPHPSCFRRTSQRTKMVWCRRALGSNLTIRQEDELPKKCKNKKCKRYQRQHQAGNYHEMCHISFWI